jgi:RHS repeat-associated protein
MNKANGFLAVRIALALGLVLAFILWVMAQYPPPVDSDGDGLTDDEELSRDFSPLWQAYSHGGFDEYLYYIAWAEVMYAPPSSPSGMFTDPFEADTDGDGLSDYEEIYDESGCFRSLGTNPLLADTDLDGVDDKTEIEYGYNPCSPDTFNLDIDSNGDGVCDWAHLLTGEDPFAPPAAQFLGSTAQDIEAWSLTPSIIVPWIPASLCGMTLYRKTVTVNKTSPWQLFFVAGDTDGRGTFGFTGHIAIEVDGAPFIDNDWDGSCEVFHLPVGDTTNATVTVTLSVPDALPYGAEGMALVFSPIHLLRWSPNVSFQSSYPSPSPLVEVAANGVRHLVTMASESNAVFCYELDISSHPEHQGSYPYYHPLPASELAELNTPPAALVPNPSRFSPMDAYGRGGTVSIPSYATVETITAPDADTPTRLVFIKPEVTRSGSGISPKPLGELGGGWPLTTKAQKKAWRGTFAAAGVSRGNITVTTGLEDFDLPSDLLNISIGGVPGNTRALPVPSVQPAGGGGFQTLGTVDDPCDCVECGPDETKICIESGGTVLWSGCVDDDDEDDEDDDDEDDPCTEHCTEGCDPVCTCTTLGSFRFRASLGSTGNGTPAGAVWIALDTPQPVTTALFHVLAAPDVITSASGQTVTATAPERIALLEPAPGGGVRLTVTSTGSQTLHARWTFTNPAADAIRVVRESAAGNGDETFTFQAASGAWIRTDNLRGVTETLETETSPDGQSKTETRTVTAAGVPLSETVTCREIIGGEARVTCRAGTGPSGAAESFFTYWLDPGNARRNGKLKLRSGNASDWRYTDVDAEGRPVLTAGPLAGSLPGGIADLEPAGPADLAAAGLQCLATVSGYSPDLAAGDSGHPADSGKARETAVYAVYAGAPAPVPVSLVRRVYTRGVDAETGYPTLAALTTRYPDPSSPVTGQPSFILSFAGSEAGADLPAALWSLPLLEITADGVTNTHAYAFGDYDPDTRSFTEDPSGPFLRTVSVSSASPLAEVTVSEPGRGNVHFKETYYVSPVTSYPLSWEATSHDADGRPLATLYSDGTVSSNDYGGSCGCRLTAAVGRDGVRTEYWSDPADPLWSATAVLTADPATYAVTETFRDGIGRVTNTVRCVWNGSWLGGGARAASPAPLETFTDYSLSSLTFARHDDTTPSGFRTIHEPYTQDALTGECVYDYGDGDDYNFTETVNIRGGGSTETRIHWRYGDNEWTETTQTRAVAYPASGLRVETAATESSDLPSVTNSVTVYDALGRVLSVSTPAFGGGRLVASNFYDGATARLIRQARAGQPDTLYAYDPYGRPAVSALDVNGNGTIDYAGPDRVTATYETYERDASNDWWRVTASVTYPDTGSPAPLTNALTRVRLTGLGLPPPVTYSMLPVTSHLTAQSETFTPASSAPLRETTFTAAAAATVWALTETPGCAVPALRKTVAGRLAMTVSSSGVTNLFEYDALNRQTAAIDGRGNTNSVQYNAVGQISSTADASGATTTYGRDTRGRATAVTDALGNTVHTAYDSAGNITAQWGAAYPVAYGYDTQNRRTLMITPGNAESSGAIGSWRLSEILWYLYIANPDDPEGYPYQFVVTQWQHDPATGLRTDKVYADGASESYTFTPDGKPLRTTWARGDWKENQYDALGQLSGVIYSDGTPAVTLARNCFGTITNAADAAGLVYAYAVSDSQTVTNETATIGSRVFNVIRTRDAFNRPITTAIRLTNTVHASKTRVYDSENRLSALTFTNSYGRVCTAAYAHADGRETNLTVTLPNGNTFTRALARDAHRPWLAARHDYAFNGSPFLWYACNHDILGRVTNAVDSFSVLRNYLYNARSEVTGVAVGTNTAAYLYDPIGNRISATENTKTTEYLANNLNQYSQISVPSAPPREPQYDADGNMLSDGTFAYTWDAENRLTSATPLNPVPSSKRISHRYDWRHRLTTLTTQTFDGSAWASHSVRTFIYDGWLLALELVDRADGTRQAAEYFWGADLSGTEQGAGGVGGLIAVSVDGVYHLPCYDHNGNVTAYVSETGSLSAQYLYDAFGNALEQSGPMAAIFRHRFSTKYFIPETHSYYYGYRHYAPKFGCWMSRDPIGENGGLNLYLFVLNNPANGFDYLGTTSVKIETRIEKRKDKFDIPKGFLIVTATIVSPPKEGNIINFLQLKKPVGQDWSIDAVKGQEPYYYDSTELQKRTTRNEDSQASIEFGDRPGGALSGSVNFYLTVVEINRTCMKDKGVFGTLRCYDKIKILADRFWTFNPSGSPEFSFDAHTGDSGAMKSVLQSLLDSKKWNIPYLCPVKITVE